MKVGKIETEKQFTPKIGRIAFELDIFAETTDRRMVIELQKVEYEYGFDRFLHYFLMLLAEQQASAKEYKIKRNVYLILLMTQPYKLLKDLDGRDLNAEMLVTTFNAEDSANKKIPLYAHKFICLNPNHKQPETPKAVRDWLELIYESINNPELPNINRENVGINKAADLIDMNKLTPMELESKKQDEAAKTTKELYEQLAKEEATQTERIKRIKKALENGKLTLEDISEMFDISVEEVNVMKREMLHE